MKGQSHNGKIYSIHISNKGPECKEYIKCLDKEKNDNQKKFKSSTSQGKYPNILANIKAGAQSHH